MRGPQLHTLPGYQQWVLLTFFSSQLVPARQCYMTNLPPTLRWHDLLFYLALHWSDSLGQGHSIAQRKMEEPTPEHPSPAAFLLFSLNQTSRNLCINKSIPHGFILPGTKVRISYIPIIGTTPALVRWYQHKFKKIRWTQVTCSSL